MGLVITVTHLTRMSGDRICVAGITDSGWFVRPDCDGYLRRSDVPGLFSLGARVDLGPTRKVPEPPQTENVHFERSRARQIQVHELHEIEELIAASAVADLGAAFGPAMKQTPGGAPYLEPGNGSRSLATLAAAPGHLELTTDRYSRTRGRWTDPIRGRCERIITDLRVYPDVYGAADPACVSSLQDATKDCDSLYLSVGLSKPWAPPDGPRGLWLQLNSVLPITRPNPVPEPHAAASAAWASHSAEKLASYRALYPDTMAKHPRAWAPWNDREDADLVASYEAGMKAAALARRHQRNPGAVRSRLKKLGIIE
jgi:hypothetical protein